MIKTGIIIGFDPNTTTEHLVSVTEYLNERFPNVTFAVVAGAVDSLAFPFEVPDEDHVDGA
jgi:hypothetical protein